MTRNFHDFYRQHLIRSKYRNQKRPILINNWEATYFDFNTEKLWILQNLPLSTALKCWLWMMAGLDTATMTVQVLGTGL